MKSTLGKNEKLKSRKAIELLFESGERLKSYPLQLIYLKFDHKGDSPVKVGFSVPKRSVKLAVDRNRIKRLMREGYRKNKMDFMNEEIEPHVLMFIYSSNKEIKYDQLELSIQKLLTNFLKINKNYVQD